MTFPNLYLPERCPFSLENQVSEEKKQFQELTRFSLKKTQPL